MKLISPNRDSKR